MAETTAYIGLGSNLGDRKGNIDKALKILAEAGRIELGRVSDIIETAALASASQPKYLNAVAELKTTLSAESLHKILVNIEAALGRVRREIRRPGAGREWSPRTIDLDLLLFGGEVVDRHDLTVPHPQMHFRSFVLKGLCQLDGELIHPVLNVPVRELEARLNGGDFAPDPDRPQLVSIAGVIGVGKTTLARRLAERLGCKVQFEPYDTNPFLPQVYAGRKELALDSQLFFLTGRAQQLDPNLLAQGHICISDYVFDKEQIYARRLLDAQQLALYEKIYPPFAAKVAPPVLVIYMRDSAANCLERIHGRNRPYEQRIELQFLQALDHDYEQLFKRWRTCPVIRVSTSEASDVDRLVHQIKSYTMVADK
jgi:2-amino-4-hydroxy-6-hydroxymethyldihydropteridine diphosphokinase